MSQELFLENGHLSDAGLAALLHGLFLGVAMV